MKRILYIFLFLIFLLPFPVLSEPADHVVINEIQTGETGAANNEFIKLYNPTSETIYLYHYKLRRMSAKTTTSSPLITFPENSKIKKGEFLTIGHPYYTGNKNFQYSSASYYISNDYAVLLLDNSENEIDKVAFGNNSHGEGAPAPNPPLGQSIIRKIDGWDTNNNANDFKLSTQETEEKYDVPASGSAIDGVYINEVMPDPASPQSDMTDEWIELYNDTGSRIDLSGAILRDSIGVVHEYNIPSGTFIEPKNYIVFYSSATKITLNNDGDTVELLDRFKTSVDLTPNYGKASVGQTFALFPDGWQWTKRPTPLSFNILEEDAATAKVSKTSSAESKKKSSASKNSKSKSKPSSSVKGASAKKGFGDSPISSAFATTENSGKPLNGKTLGIILLLLSFVVGAVYIINREKIYELYQQKN